MAEPFIGEIKMVGFNFAPRGWAFCNGQIMSIAQNQALFSLLGTTYGGDGRTTFALPDLRSRTPIGFGNGAGLNVQLGQSSGSETVTLTQAELPAHNHMWNAVNAAANQPRPDGILVAQYNPEQEPIFATGGVNTTMNAASVASTGGSQPHNNMQPFLVLNFCIALVGIFPSRN